MNLEDKISEWIKEYLNKSKNDCLVVGISGGIDSALTSTLCARTGRKTILVTMPIHQNIDETNRGIEHINWLKSKYKNIIHLHIDLTESYESIKNAVPNNCKTDLALANTRARIRMTNLYLISGSNNGIVVGTGNKVEDFGIGFFTKYGDGGVDVSPIADLLKSEVYKIGKALGISKEILNAPPTDGLWEEDKTDESQIGATYLELEWAMSYNKKNKLDKRQKEVLNIFKKFNANNKHKMKPIPVCEIPQELK